MKLSFVGKSHPTILAASVSPLAESKVSNHTQMQQYFGKAMDTEHYMHTLGRKQNKTKTPPNNQPQWLSVSFYSCSQSS